MISFEPIGRLADLSAGIVELAARFPAFNAETVWERLAADVYRPYRVVKDGEGVADIVLHVATDPPELSIVYMHGSGFVLNQETRAALKKLGETLGCCDTEGGIVVRFSSAREEWRRVAPRFGFQEVSTNYRAVL